MEEVKSVSWLLWKLKDLEGLQHWLLQLGPFHLKFCHISGSDNVAAYCTVTSLSFIIATTILTPVLCYGSLVWWFLNCVVILCHLLWNPFVRVWFYFKLITVNEDFLCGKCHTASMLQCVILNYCLWLAVVLNRFCF